MCNQGLSIFLQCDGNGPLQFAANLTFIVVVIVWTSLLGVITFSILAVSTFSILAVSSKYHFYTDVGKESSNGFSAVFRYFCLLARHLKLSVKEFGYFGIWREDNTRAAELLSGCG